MPTANPIKLPVVITADGTQAQAGFAKLRNSMQGLERGFGRYLSTQAGAITGMVAGFFTIEALFSGIQKLIARGEEVNKRISQFSPEAVGAQARLQGAQIRQDVATSGLLGPQIAAVTARQQAALPAQGVIDMVASNVASDAQDYFTVFKEEVARLITGGVVGNDTGVRKAVLGGLAGGLGIGLAGGNPLGMALLPAITAVDPLDEMERKLQEAQAAAPMPAPGVPFEQQSDQVKEAVETINLLREAVQELRGMNRQLKAN